MEKAKASADAARARRRARRNCMVIELRGANNPASAEEYGEAIVIELADKDHDDELVAAMVPGASEAETSNPDFNSDSEGSGQDSL